MWEPIVSDTNSEAGVLHMRTQAEEAMRSRPKTVLLLGLGISSSPGSCLDFSG